MDLWFFFTTTRVPPHTAKRTISYANELGFEILRHPPYFPGNDPTDLYASHPLQHQTSNKIYHSDEEVKNDVTKFLKEKPNSGPEESMADGKSLFQKVVTITG